MPDFGQWGTVRIDDLMSKINVVPFFSYLPDNKVDS